MYELEVLPYIVENSSDDVLEASFTLAVEVAKAADKVSTKLSLLQNV